MHWLLAVAAALMTGVSKTAVPGAGILVAPMLAAIFGGFQSVGIMLPMLIFGDVFAIAWYRRHAQWDKIVGLLPWVIAGMGVGVAALWVIGESDSTKDVLGMVIGVLVLGMLAMSLAQDRLDERFTPRSKAGVAGTGVAAGFTTMVSNAAGPIMTVYMTAHRLPKKQFMGTLAWYFFLLNLSKLPVYAALTAAHPDKPIITGHSLLFNLVICPVILVGVFIGRWLLPRLSQEVFERTVVILAAAAAVRLIAGAL
ncbi:MAG: sulfite exporter TauE/SafE family protein [Armatimonadota bacterium]|nr:sulfite exporter TauE/SafE family protein [Armatimonadota bacterium]